MISILVPVYNTSVFKLVNDLSQQIAQNKLQAEIIVFDDFSDEAYRFQNKLLTTLPGVCYKLLEMNHGRVAIRKLLASSAKNEWLLFIDGDSSMISKDYLINYCHAIDKKVDVIQGGRTYASIPPAACNKRLHWHYGRMRENIDNVKFRFHSNNFCIRKSVFEQLTFPEDITGYGHEDTWIGIQLDLLQARIFFINNPVLHEGIESSDVFLTKSINALHNLLKLAQKTDEELLIKHVRIFSAFCKLKSLRLELFILLLYKATRKIILNNLTSCRPSLLFFDYYRLGKLIEIYKQQKTLER